MNNNNETRYKENIIPKNNKVTTIKIHRGICGRCQQSSKVLRYHQPIKATVDGIDIELGKHVDLYQTCLAHLFSDDEF